MNTKLTFESYIDNIAEKYQIEHDYFSGLGMPHGIYTGGETLCPCTKKEIKEIHKPMTKSNLDYYLNDALNKTQKKELTPDRWDFLIKSAIGEIARYEWEHIRNNLKVDKSLRKYMDELIKYKS